ncbi:MAG: SDR family oxidoreductase [Sphingomonas sp.]|nr:SDR family oxidoreductase [Sphingomonas sp.]
MSPAPAPLALVTGGHRRLGARIAMRLARAGYALAIHGRHDAVPHPFLADCLAETGVDWCGFVADFETPAAAEALMPAIIAHFGRAPDLLVNSASLFGQDRLDVVTGADLSAHFAVNAVAPVLLTQAFAQAKREAGRDPSIVNLLDQRLAQPHGDQLAYTISKYALDGFTRIAARELAPHVRVNAVAPGLTLPTEDYDEAQMARLASDMPLERLPDTEDVSEAVLYLAQARAVTGQTLFVDAGAHMRSYPRDFMHLE